MDIDINNIINQDTFQVDTGNIELPVSMSEGVQNTGNTEAENTQVNSEDTEKTATLSLEQISGIIIIGYDAISKAIYRRIEPNFDATLTQDEKTAIEEPLKLVLQQYNIQVTPVTALCMAVIGVNMAKIMQLKMYRVQLAKQYEVEQKESEFNSEFI